MLRHRYATATSVFTGVTLALILFVFVGAGDTPGGYVLAWLSLATMVWSYILRFRIERGDD